MSTHSPEKIFVAVPQKSTRDAADWATEIPAGLSPSWVKRMIKLALGPPDTGGVATDRIRVSPQ